MRRMSQLFAPILLSFFAGVSHQALAISEPLAQAIFLYERDYESLELDRIALTTIENFDNFGRLDTLTAQQQFFSALDTSLDQVRAADRAGNEATYFALLEFELELHQTRLDHLAQQRADALIDRSQNLFQWDDGEFWYTWLLQKWTGTLLSPEQIKLLGEERLAQLNQQVDALHKRHPELNTGNNKDSLVGDVERLNTLFYEHAATIEKHLPALVPVDSLEPFKIARGENEALAQTPGYYNRAEKTFHYNLFDTPFDTHNIDWLLIHEANPGHHLELTLRDKQQLAKFRRQLNYPSFSEGWAAYVEQLGKQLGLFEHPGDELAMLEWKRIRAIRVILDVALNYEGWSKEQALNYWSAHLPVTSPEIRIREVDRMLRWPAQVASYVVGAILIESRWQQWAVEHSGSSRLEFHTWLLNLGPVPPGILANLSSP